MSERSGGELLEERSCISRKSERSGISERSGVSRKSERSGISERSDRSQISEKSQRSDKSQLSETRVKLNKTEDKLAAFACSLNSEPKSEVDMHPLREVRKLVIPEKVRVSINSPIPVTIISLTPMCDNLTISRMVKTTKW